MTPERLWASYCAATGHSGPLPEVDTFGDTPELRDDLLALVLAGTKRATCGLLRDYGGMPPPVGEHTIITDGSDVPRAIIRTTRTEIRPIRDVPASFARREGEGDLTLDWWKREHDAFFTRQAAREGFTYSDAMPGVMEDFELVWPLPDIPSR